MEVIGFIRRVDDLGRIIIPKEIRKSLEIKDGTPLKIFTVKEGKIVLEPCQDDSRVVDNFIETFKEMNVKDKKAIVKMLVDEMG